MSISGKRGDPPAGPGEPPRRGAWQGPGAAAVPRSQAPSPPGKEKMPAPVESPTRPHGTLPGPAAAAGRHMGSPEQPSAHPAARAPRITFRRGGSRSPGPALVSRGERVLFWSMLAAVVAMGIYLLRYRERVDAHFQSRAMAVPLSAGTAGASRTPLQLYLADDATGALVERSLDFPLPADPNMRARVVLTKLLSEYTAAGALHPLPPGASGAESVDEVYLSPIPGGGRGELAVVDLTSTFVHTHPSGIEPEMLTLLSMIATLHANLPSVTEVRFLVDGESRPTLAGHADLERTYLAGAAQMAPSEAFTTATPVPSAAPATGRTQP